MIKISQAKLNEVNKIYTLGKNIHELDFSGKYPFHEVSELKEFIKNKKENIFFVAKLNGKVVGFLFAMILAHSAGGWCMLDNLAIEKFHRGKGISNKLLRELYKELKKRKIHYIQILEEAHHKNTRSFWKKQGYAETTNFLWAEKWIK